MLAQSEGKIFLANERGHAEEDWFRSYNTFNFGMYQNAVKTPFGALYMLNDDTVAGGRSRIQFVENDTDIILIPVVGTIRYTDNMNCETFIEAGQVQQHTLRKGTTFEVGNPYENELVNYIQIGMKRGDATFSKPHVFPFSLEPSRNTLVQVIPNAPDKKAHAPKLFMGLFTGREDTTYNLSNPQSGVFVFVLQGAFEVQYRLLETSDGLALWNTAAVELEALSNDAILLLLEVPLV